MASLQIISADDAARSTSAEQPLARSLWLWTAALVVLGAAALPLDLLFAFPFVGETQSVVWDEVRDELREVAQLGQTFAHGYGALTLMIALFFIDRARRRTLVRVASIVVGAGLWTLLLKILVVRTRPRIFFDENLGEFAGNVLQTFGHEFGVGNLGYAHQSFPSGHMAVAVALAICFSWLYPHARGFFITMAIFAGLERMIMGHHYLSDVLWGSAVGCAWAAVYFTPQLMGGWLDRFENGTLRLWPPQRQSVQAAA